MVGIGQEVDEALGREVVGDALYRRAPASVPRPPRSPHRPDAEGRRVRRGREDRPFEREKVVAAIRADQEGRSDFPEFVAAIWAAGVWHFEVDLDARTCTYVGHDGGRYVESYDAVTPTRTGQSRF
jgi:hypothetical protein